MVIWETALKQDMTALILFYLYNGQSAVSRF